MKIIIVGLGGIGSILSNTIARYVSTKEKPGYIYLVDGDSYELKNFIRQEFCEFGNKADVKKNELEIKFDNGIINFRSFPQFLNESLFDLIVEDDSVIFLCVDNHKTRKMVSDLSHKLKNITVISGGNEITDGNVQIFIRKDGVNVTPSLTDYHPEIENYTDKSPDEMSCEELSKSEPQLYFTNFMVAAHMCSAYYNITEKGNNKISEVYFDNLTMNANSKVRVPKTKKQNENKNNI